MKIQGLLYFLLPGICCVSACNKFLDVKPKGVIIASTINDYEAILNDGDIVNSFGLTSPLLASDDVTDLTLQSQNQLSPPGNVYFWHPYINASNEKPDIWQDLYRRIANLNVITEGVMTAENGTEKKKRQLYAEAMVCKSFCYFHLLSFFSPAYNKNTAATDFGVPYVTSTDISVPTPVRPAFGAFMQQLTGDLLKAVPDLESTNINNSRVTRTVAFAMLSRWYMNMQEYDLALQYADSVINSGQAAIVNYNDYLAAKALPLTNSSPEEIFVRYSNNVNFRYSNDLISNYDTANDLRIRFFAKRNVAADQRILNYNNFQQYNPNRGITYAEILLNKAECLARKGNITAAMDIVNNDIRRYRFTPAAWQPLEAATTEAAITQVLAERRRELAFKGIRWSDMKRLDQEKRMPAVKRYAADGITVMATLEPGSLRYTYQIPLQVQSFNQDMPLNKQ